MDLRFIFIAGIQLIITAVLITTVPQSEREQQPQGSARATKGDQQPTNRPPQPDSQFSAAENQSGTSPKATHQENQPMQEATAWIQAISAAVTVGLTVWLAFYAHKGWEAADKNAKAAEDNANAAKAAIVLTNPPKIIVREIDVPETIHIHAIATTPEESRIDALILDVLRRNLEEGVQLTGSFRMTNKGGSEATTTLIEAMLWIGERLPQVNPVFGRAIGRNVKLTAGGTTTIEFEAPLALSAREQSDVHQKRTYIWAIGKIVYVNPLGHGRRTGFARRFNVDTGRFDRFPDQDYDYED